MNRAARMPSIALARVGFLALAAVALGVGIATFWPWISDDAFISLRYARRLAAGDGLTWNDGEAVEGYSNLLWILLTVALRPLGLDWVTIVRGLGIAATFATVAVLAWTRWPGGDGRRGQLVAAAPALLLGALAPVALWAIGGLETPLALLLTTVGFGATGRILWDRDEVATASSGSALLAGLAFALLAWTRPDGPLAGVLAAAAVAAFGQRARWRTSAAIALPVGAAVITQLLFRLAYYGDYVPNTAHVKVGASAETFAQGLEYFASTGVVLRSLLVPAAVGLTLGLLQRRARPFALLVLAFALLWSIYVASVGGDLFPLARIVLPALGPLALTAALGLGLLARTRLGTALATLLLTGSIALALHDRTLDPTDPYQQLSDWEWRGEPVGEWLGEAFGAEQPLLALDAAGAVPFYSELPCLDMLGLNDRHIATAPLPARAHVVPGHSRGDGGYVLDREPDLVLFASPTGDPSPRWPGAWQMERDPRFLRDYRCVVCRTGPVPVRGAGERDLAITLWVRLAGRVGLQPTAGDPDGERGAFVLPGYLIGSHRQALPLHRHESPAPTLPPARLAAAAAAGQAMLEWWTERRAIGVLRQSGAVAARLDRAGSYVVEDLPLPADRALTALAEPRTAAVALQLRPTAVPGGRGLDLVVTVPADAPLPVHVDRVRFLPR